MKTLNGGPGESLCVRTAPPQFDREEVPLRYKPDERVAADSGYAVAPTTVLQSRQQQQPPASHPTEMTNGKRRGGSIELLT